MKEAPLLNGDGSQQERPRRIDVAPSIVLAGLSVIFMWGGVGLGLGSPFRLGTGAFPFFSGLILLGFSVALILPTREEKRPAADWISFCAICGALAVFASTTDRLGLIPGAFLTIVVASLPDNSLSWRGKLILAGVVSLASWVLFIRLLNLPFQAFAAF